MDKPLGHLEIEARYSQSLPSWGQPASFGGEGRKSGESLGMGEGRDSKGMKPGTQNSDQNGISSIQTRSFHICSLPSPRQPNETPFVVGLFFNILSTFPNFYALHELKTQNIHEVLQRAAVLGPLLPKCPLLPAVSSSSGSEHISTKCAC